MNLCFYLGYWLKMAFFHGMLKFFKRGAKLRPSEHRVMFDESSGQRSAKRLRTSNSFFFKVSFTRILSQNFLLKSWCSLSPPSRVQISHPLAETTVKVGCLEEPVGCLERGGGHEGCWGLKLVGALWTTCLYN